MDLEKRIEMAMKIADDEGVPEESFVRSVIKAHVRAEYYAENAKDIESALTSEGRQQMFYVLNRIKHNRLFK